MYKKTLIAILFGALSMSAGAQDKKDQKKSDAAAAAETKAEPPAAPKGAAGEDYVIGAEDILSINVWREPEMSRVVPVRPDGKISVPLIGEFEAEGSTAKQLEAKILKKLETLVTNPQVTVIVQDIRSRKFSITGEVIKAGTYPLGAAMTVLDAVAMAGGLRDFARPKKMYILRRNADGTTSRINVNYKDLLEGKIADVNLQSRDTIVVP